MDYCKFQNTVKDMLDCNDGLDYQLIHTEDELKAAIKYIKLCRFIASEFNEENWNDDEIKDYLFYNYDDEDE